MDEETWDFNDLPPELQGRLVAAVAQTEADGGIDRGDFSPYLEDAPDDDG